MNNVNHNLISPYTRDAAPAPLGDMVAPASGVEPIVVRLEGVPATPTNLERIRLRVDELNSELAASGASFRVRLRTRVPG